MFVIYDPEYRRMKIVRNRLRNDLMEGLMKNKRKIKELWLKYLEDKDYDNMTEDNIIKIIELLIELKTGSTIDELARKEKDWEEISKLEEILEKILNSKDEDTEDKDTDSRPARIIILHRPDRFPF